MSNMASIDKKIGKFFDKTYRGEPKDVVLENFDESSRIHVEKIAATNPSSVLDIGMGAGGLLLALQKKGVNKIIGVDLSDNAINLATKRFEQYGNLDESITLHKGNFLNIEVEPVDAISIHQCLNNYPEFKPILKRVTNLRPKTIAVTMVQKNLRIRLRMIFIRTVLLVIGGYKIAYLHDPIEVEEMITSNGYTLDFTKTFKTTETKIYNLNETLDQ